MPLGRRVTRTFRIFQIKKKVNTENMINTYIVMSIIWGICSSLIIPECERVKQRTVLSPDNHKVTGIITIK